MIISIGSDHAGFKLKSKIIKLLDKEGYKIIDVGTDSEESCDYPDFSNLVCDQIIEESADIGILICGTGIGMSIASNRRSGIRAGLVLDEYMAKKSRQHNDCNVLVLGAKLIEDELAKKIVKTFISTEFEGGRHSSRLKKIS